MYIQRREGTNCSLGSNAAPIDNFATESCLQDFTPNYTLNEAPRNIEVCVSAFL